MAPGPADAAEVLETGQVTAEVGALLRGAHRAQRVLQVRVDLHLQQPTQDNPYALPLRMNYREPVTKNGHREHHPQHMIHGIVFTERSA